MEPGVHAGLPSGNLTFILSLDGPTDIVGMPGAQSPGRFHTVVGGLHVRPALIAHSGHGAGLAIETTPLGARALFGIPAGALAGSIVELEDLLGALAAQLVDRVREAHTWQARFSVVDELLTGAFTEPGFVACEVVHAWDLLVRSGGRVRIEDIAVATGWSRRHLTARFRAEFGVPPKTAGRILRFQRTCALLDRGLSLAEAAVAGGYYDQAHLTNDWQVLAGASPLAWLSDELRDRHVDHFDVSLAR